MNVDPLVLAGFVLLAVTVVGLVVAVVEGSKYLAHWLSIRQRARHVASLPEPPEPELSSYGRRKQRAAQRAVELVPYGKPASRKVRHRSAAAASQVLDEVDGFGIPGPLTIAAAQKFVRDQTERNR